MLFQASTIERGTFFASLKERERGQGNVYWNNIQVSGRRRERGSSRASSMFLASKEQRDVRTVVRQGLSFQCLLERFIACSLDRTCAWGQQRGTNCKMAARNREHEEYSVFSSFFVSPGWLRSSADDVDCIIGGAGRASLQCGLWLENCSIEIENDKNNKSRRRKKEARVFTATLHPRGGGVVGGRKKGEMS